MARLIILLAISFLVSAPGAQAQANSAQKNSDLFEGLGQEQLDEPGAHWVWVTDLILRHSQLFDAGTGKMLAGLNSAFGAFPKPPIFSDTRSEYYMVEAKYEWGHRGPRTDFVTVYDAQTLKPKGQIVIPTQTAESASNIGYSALLDGNRLLGLFNQFPTQSVSIVDLEARTFVDSIPTGGCAGVYATGPRSFASICGDGTIRRVELDARGNLAKEDSTGVFFESVDDPIMMKGARLGSRWYFISFAGVIHEVDFSQSPPTTHAWSGVDDAEKAAGWRPGGRQLTAIHRKLSRLYVSFHQGGPGSHKAPGPEVWVFDLNTRQRISRFELPNSDATAVAGLTGLAGGFSGWLLQKIIPSTGGDTLTVTQDSEPLLLVRNSALPVLAVLDAQSGAHMRDILEIGFSGNRLTVPR